MISPNLFASDHDCSGQIGSRQRGLLSSGVRLSPRTAWGLSSGAGSVVSSIVARSVDECALRTYKTATGLSTAILPCQQEVLVDRGIREGELDSLRV